MRERECVRESERERERGDTNVSGRGQMNDRYRKVRSERKRE